MKIKFFRISALVCSGLAGLCSIAIWQNHQMWMLQKIHPAERIILSNFNSCSSNSPNWLKQSLDHAMDGQGAVSGQSVYISPQGDFYHCEIGLTRKSGLVPVSPEHRYRFASLTKIVTANALLQVLRRNNISVQAKLVDFYPEIDLSSVKDERIGDITLAHLINHQAGFHRGSLLGDPMFVINQTPWCPNDIKRLADVSLTFDPGAEIRYSNLGYCLIGDVIARISGQPFKIVIEQMFDFNHLSLGWAYSGFADNEVKYDYRFETDYDDRYLGQFDFEAIASSAGITGSAGSFARLLFDMPVMPSHRSQPCNKESLSGCYENGLQVYKPSDSRITLHVHEGYLPGSSSVAIFDSYGGVTVLVMSGSNRPQSNPEDNWIPWFHRALSDYYQSAESRVP